MVRGVVMIDGYDKRKWFDPNEYNADALCYNAIVKNALPFLIPPEHKENYGVDVLLTKMFMGDRIKWLQTPIGVELELRRQWKNGSSFPYPNINFIISKVKKYSAYKYRGKIIPCFYCIMSNDLQYCALTFFNNLPQNDKYLYLTKPSNNHNQEYFYQFPFDQYTRIITTKDFGKFFYLWSTGKSTKELWL